MVRTQPRQFSTAYYKTRLKTQAAYARLILELQKCNLRIDRELEYETTHENSWSGHLHESVNGIQKTGTIDHQRVMQTFIHHEKKIIALMTLLQKFHRTAKTHKITLSDPPTDIARNLHLLRLCFFHDRKRPVNW